MCFVIPNLNGVRAFDAAARRLNFRLAAQDLNVTQGAVAQHVRRLEAELGLKLFDREARGLSLTEAGARYRIPVRNALAMIEDATGRLLPSARRVTISVPPSFATKWLAPRLARFAEAHPDVELQTVASEALADFRTDGVDLAIRQGPAPRPKAALTSVFLGPLRLIAVSAPGSDVATDISGFARQPLTADGHDHWRALFDDAGLSHAGRVTRFNQTALAIDAAAGGLGAAIAPRILVADDLAAGRVKEVWRPRSTGDEDENRGFHLIFPSGAGSAARDAVVNWLLSETASNR